MTTAKALNLKQFINPSQLSVMRQLVKGEEGAHFSQMILKLKSHIISMPKTYETNGQGDDAIVSLHYFKGGSDWWITERDMVREEQIQAFGYVCLNGDVQNAELGYINIDELIRCGVELDLYFQPITLREVKEKLSNKKAAQKKEARASEPSLDQIFDWLADGGCEATDGCWVEPDGICPHDCKSWALEMGLA